MCQFPPSAFTRVLGIELRSPICLKSFNQCDISFLICSGTSPLAISIFLFKILCPMAHIKQSQQRFCHSVNELISLSQFFFFSFIFFSWCLETGFHYVGLTVVKITLQTMLVSTHGEPPAFSSRRLGLKVRTTTTKLYKVKNNNKRKDWHRTHYVHQVGLELTELPLSTECWHQKRNL